MECHGKNSDSQLVPCCIATKPSSDLVFVTVGKQVSVFHSRCDVSGVLFRLRLISILMYVQQVCDGGQF